MTEKKDTPASEALIEVNSEALQPSAAPPVAPEPEQPVYTATVSVYRKRVTVVGGQRGEKSQPRVLFPGIAAAGYYPPDPDLPNLLVIARNTRAKAVEDVQEWSKKWMHRTAALFAWVVFGSYIFAPRGVVGTLLDYFSERDIAREWEGLVLIVLLGAIAVVSAFIPRKTSALAVLYVLFFPLVAFFVLLSQFFNLFSFARLLFGTLGRFLLRGANWTFLLVACVAVNKDIPRGLLVVILFYLLAGAAYIVTTNFMWVTNPLGTLTSVTDWIARLAFESLQKDSVKVSGLMRQYDASREPAREARKAEVLKEIENLTTTMNGAVSVAEKTKHATGRVVLFYLFTARFLGALFLIILVFGGIFRGIGKLAPGAFTGSDMASFWDAFYYSIVTFFTVGDGSIAPRLFIAQVAIVCEIVFAVMTLTVLLLSFSTVSVDVAQENGRYIEERAREYVKRAYMLLGTHWDVGENSPKEFLQRLKSDFAACRKKKS